MEEIKAEHILKAIKKANKDLQQILDKLSKHSSEFAFMEDYQTIMNQTRLIIAKAKSIDKTISIEEIEKILLTLLNQSNELKIFHEKLIENQKALA